MLVTDQPEPTRQAERIVAMQRDVVLPSKAGVILVVLYYLFYSGWLYEVPTTRSVLWIRRFARTFSPRSNAGLHRSSSTRTSRDFSIP